MSKLTFILVRLSHHSNISFPNSVTVAGIVILVKLSQYEKASSLIFVTPLVSFKFIFTFSFWLRDSFNSFQILSSIFPVRFIEYWPGSSFLIYSAASEAFILVPVSNSNKSLFITPKYNWLSSQNCFVISGTVSPATSCMNIWTRTCILSSSSFWASPRFSTNSFALLRKFCWLNFL